MASLRIRMLHDGGALPFQHRRDPGRRDEGSCGVSWSAADPAREWWRQPCAERRSRGYRTLVAIVDVGPVSNSPLGDGVQGQQSLSGGDMAPRRSN